MKGLIKRSNGIYYIRVYQGGRQQWRSTGERNRKKAIRVAKGLISEEPPQKEVPDRKARKAVKTEESGITDTSVTLNQIIELGREYAVLHGRDKSVESWKTARRCLLRVGRLAGADTVEELAQRLPDLRENPPSLKKVTFESYLGNAASLFSRVRLEFYTSRGIIVRNPFQEIRICRKVAHPFVLPTKEQMRSLKGKMDADLRVDDLMVYRVLLMAMGGGLRAQEITHVRWHAIGTWQTYAGRLRLIADAVNAETVVELQGAAMYIRNALGDQRKQVTKESYLRNAAALFCPERLDAYSKMGFDLPDPFEGLKIKRNFRTSYTLPPPDKISQLRVLLNDLRDSDILAFRILAVALATGARSQEIAHLHWQDISASSITIQPDPESQWEPKSHQERTISTPNPTNSTTTRARSNSLRRTSNAPNPT